MTIAWGASLPASEAVSLMISIIYSKCEVIQVEQCEARKAHYAMLSYLLLDWWHVGRKHRVIVPVG